MELISLLFSFFKVADKSFAYSGLMAALMMSGCAGVLQSDLNGKDKYLGDVSSDSPHDAKARNQKIQRLIADANKYIESDRNLTVPGTEFRDLLKDGSFGPQMVVIPAGSFLMGDNQSTLGYGYTSEHVNPVHSVEIEHSFAIGQYEVTVAEFSDFVADSGYVTLAEQKQGCEVIVGAFFRRRGGLHRTLPDASWRNPHFNIFYVQELTEPVTCISWYDAVAYTEWLSEQTGERYRLPIEEEWEYAARGGTKTSYWWGNKESKSYANYGGYAPLGKFTEPVGSYEANPFGIHDTAGNVSEWVFNRDSFRYGVHRGGSWKSSPLTRGDVSPATRWELPYDSASFTIGFRVVRPLP